MHEIERLVDLEVLPSDIFVQYGNTPPVQGTCRGAAFLDMEEFIERMQDTDIVLCHCGAGTIIEAIRAGKYPIVVPRQAGLGEHIDDHQLELAHALHAEGHVYCVDPITQLEHAIRSVSGRAGSPGTGMHDSSLVHAVRRDLRRLDIRKGF